jgi:hypothetical protein
MTTETDVTTDNAGDGGQQQDGAGPQAAVTFTAEQQTAIDKLISDRLKRAKAQWQTDADTKAKADADAAEAKRQAEQGEWEKLARTNEGRVTELDGLNKDLTARIERADKVITTLVETRKAGLPEAMLKALDGRDIYDQLEIANAYHASAPAQPANGQPGRTATTPTPAPQGPQKLTDEERRARAVRTF